LYNDAATYNNFVDKISEEAWNVIFDETDISRFVTNGVRKDFEAFREGNKRVDFTKSNIKNLLYTLGSSMNSIMDEALLRVFDELTRYDKKNIVHWEGWKTNDAWRVNKKVIIPYVIEISFADRPHFSYSSRGSIIDDIDRVMCSLSGKNFNNILTIRESMQKAFEQGWDVEVESEFFTIRYYKKGTVHLKFKDDKLLLEFNMCAAKSKKWLPGDK